MEYILIINLQNNNGKCVPCKCNNRADSCNSTTGICNDCRNNTAGKECNECASFYYGDAMTYDCKSKKKLISRNLILICK